MSDVNAEDKREQALSLQELIYEGTEKDLFKQNWILKSSQDIIEKN